MIKILYYKFGYHFHMYYLHSTARAMIHVIVLLSSPEHEWNDLAHFPHSCISVHFAVQKEFRVLFKHFF